jgi:hypothetical protein
VRTRLLATACAVALLTACSGGNVEPELITAERELTGLFDRTLDAVDVGETTSLERTEGECQDADLAGIGLWLRSQTREWVMPVADIDDLIEAVAEHWRGAEGLEVRVAGEPGDTAAFGRSASGIRISVERAWDPGAVETEVRLAGSTGCHRPVLEPRFDPEEPPPTPVSSS